MFDETCGIDFTPSADGIVHCLRMLASEAALLKMERTLDALFVAIETCAEEHRSMQGLR